MNNILGLLYFLIFQICGVLISFCLLKHKPYFFRLLTGSVFGSVLLQWTPCIFAFAFGFSLLSHYLALTLVILSTVSTLIFTKFKLQTLKPTYKINIFTISILSGIFMIFFGLCVHSFRFEDGIYYSSQATFGDMSMHLGFITSIAEQQTFPPMYSILPTQVLSYPFLSDSISSSVYLFGSSLIFAYLLPMFFAGLQVIGGLYYFAKTWLKERSKVLLTCILFFLCGGFGVFYFLSGTIENPSNFTQIFTEFYKTPTNLTTENIRFVNSIVDMMLPQRATLFGWAVLFTTLTLLLSAMETKSKKEFIIVGILAGALPMIHTHSFLALGIVSASWLAITIAKKLCNSIIIVLCALPICMTIIQYSFSREDTILMSIAILTLLAIFVCVIFMAIKNKFDFKSLNNWWIYLAITLVLALPQLYIWTFTQSGIVGHVRSYFGWANINDNYIWFYIKNFGLTALLFIPSILNSSKRILQIVTPIIPIFILCELIVFQPNNYDNNKLIYVAYIFICGLCANFCVDIYKKLKEIKGLTFISVVALLLFTSSAILTISREFVASYQIYSSDAVKLTEYIENNTEPSDTFLTSDRHNNEITSLTGRNIVCGAGTFLYFHGFDYSNKASAVKQMYENPTENLNLFSENDVDYIVISAYEYGNYNINIDSFDKLFKLVYNHNNIRLYQV